MDYLPTIFYIKNNTLNIYRIPSKEIKGRGPGRVAHFSYRGPGRVAHKIFK